MHMMYGTRQANVTNARNSIICGFLLPIANLADMRVQIDEALKSAASAADSAAGSADPAARAEAVISNMLRRAQTASADC